MKKKIRRYLECPARFWLYYQKLRLIERHPTMLRSVEWRRRQKQRRYTGYHFTSAYVLMGDGRKVPLQDFTRRNSFTLHQEPPMEETQRVELPALQGFSVSFRLPPSASHLFARPDGDPRGN